MNDDHKQHNSITVKEDELNFKVEDDDEENFLPESSSESSSNRFENSEFEIELINESFDEKPEDYNEKWILTEQDGLIYVTNDVDMLDADNPNSGEPTSSKSKFPLIYNMEMLYEASLNLISFFYITRINIFNV